MLMMLALLGSSWAGPWVNDAGQSYTKADYTRFAADEYVDPTGAVVEGSQYIGNTWRIYGEVGLAKGLQAVVALPFVGARNVVNDVAYANRAFGDAEVGLEAGRTLGSTPLALRLSAKVPLYDTGELLQYGLVATRFPAMGDGQVDITALFSAGTPLRLGSLGGWAAADLGYRHRTEWWLGDTSTPDRVLADGIPWRAQLGWSPRAGERELGWLAVELGGLQTPAQDEVTKSWTQVGLGLGARITGGLAFELGGWRMLSARNSALGQSISLGVSYTRRKAS